MLFAKLLGSALMLLSGGALAVGLVRREHRRAAVLSAWVELIFYIRDQIDCYLTPMDEILASADPSLLHACMCQTRPQSLNEVLECSVLYLDPDSARQINAFVHEVGGAFRDEQVKRCDRYLAVLRQLREGCAAELPRKIRLCTTLCVCGAVGVLILLW